MHPQHTGAAMRILLWILIAIAMPPDRAVAGDADAALAAFGRTDEIVSRDLATPTDANADAYLDLDTGATFKFGESSANHLADPKQWICRHGVDVMCETREPVKGLVVYDMACHPTHDPIDAPRDYEEVRKQLEPIEAQPMDFITAGEGVPRTFCFRTHDGAIGVLEMSDRTGTTPGYRVRFLLLQKLPVPLSVDFLRGQLMYHQSRLADLRDHGCNPRLLDALESRIKLLTDLEEIARRERLPRLASMQMQLAVHRYQLQGLKQMLPDDATRVVAMQQRVDVMAKRVEVELANYKMPHVQPMAPIMLLPIHPAATQPAPVKN